MGVLWSPAEISSFINCDFAGGSEFWQVGGFALTEFWFTGAKRIHAMPAAVKLRKDFSAGESPAPCEGHKDLHWSRGAVFAGGGSIRDERNDRHRRALSGLLLLSRSSPRHGAIDGQRHRQRAALARSVAPLNEQGGRNVMGSDAMFGGSMMWGAGLIWLLILIALVLAIAALIKYLRS
jgi:hypothetical protein